MKPPMAHLIDALFAFDGGRLSLRRDHHGRRARKVETERRRRESQAWARRSAARNGFGD